MIRLLGLIMLVSAPAMAEVYKWIDEEGRVHYGDSPHAAATTIEIPAEGASGDSTGAVTVEQQLQKFREMEQEDRRERREENAERKRIETEQRSDERRAEQCRQKKQKLAQHRDELRQGCLIKRCNRLTEKIQNYKTQIKQDCS